MFIYYLCELWVQELAAKFLWLNLNDVVGDSCNATEVHACLDYANQELPVFVSPVAEHLIPLPALFLVFY